MEVEFRTTRLERAYVRSADAGRQWGQAIGRKYVQRVKVIVAAADFAELRRAQALRVHRLGGDRRGQYGITLTANWRLVISLPDGEDGQRVRIEEVIDYHGR